MPAKVGNWGTCPTFAICWKATQSLLHIRSILLSLDVEANFGRQRFLWLESKYPELVRFRLAGRVIDVSGIRRSRSSDVQCRTKGFNMNLFAVCVIRAGPRYRDGSLQLSHPSIEYGAHRRSNSSFIVQTLSLSPEVACYKKRELGSCRSGPIIRD